MPIKETVPSLIDNNLPYSKVVKIGNHYHFSGVIPKLNNENKLTSPENIEFQTLEVLSKMQTLLTDCELSVDDIYSVTIMLAGSMKSFTQVNKLYSDYFQNVSVKPRRKAFAVVGLPFEALIEIEFDAVNQRIK